MSLDENQERMKQIVKRALRATSEPWSATADGDVYRGAALLFYAPRPSRSQVKPSLQVLDDAEFVAHTRSDVGWLAARVSQLEGALRDLIAHDALRVGRQLAQNALNADPLEDAPEAPVEVPL